MPTPRLASVVAVRGDAAVFAYASLVNSASAAETLGRAVEPVPARLGGWQRRWSLARDNLASEKTFAAEDGSLPRHCLGLNLEPSGGGPGPNGALIAVSDPELERLDVREIRYLRRDVTASVDPLPGGVERVFAYTAKPERFAPTPPPGSVILRTYLEAVEAAFDALGPGELDAYRQTTEPPPVPIIGATLVEDRIPPGNPRRW